MYEKHDIWTSDLGNGKYKNPVLYADYSDPDVIRVGDDYYMTASSFTYVPALPILHSKDLINWSIVNYASMKLPDFFDKPRHGCGVWAPAIRYHDGKFWIFYGDPDLGIFMTNTTDILGEWSPLHLVQEGKGIIDTCPLWDDDGRAYIVHAYAGSRAGFGSRIAVWEMAPDGTKLIGLDCCIYMGGQENHTIEGPKFYKRDGYYYIMSPAGGVVQGWQVCLRAKEIYGPYECMTVMEQRDTIFNGPHQGGWVDTQNGEDWFMNFQDRESHGRLIHINPVNWVDGWPTMGINVNDYCGEPVTEYTKPNLPKQEISYIPTSDNFLSDKLGMQWQWQANFHESWYSLTENPGHLRLFSIPAKNQELTYLLNRPNVLTQLWQAPSMRFTTKIEFGKDSYCGGALGVSGNHYSYISLDNDGKLKQISATSNWSIDIKETVEKEENININSAWLRMEILSVFNSSKAVARFSYSVDGNEYIQFGNKFTVTPGKWVGAKTAIFAFGDNNGYCDFSDFVVD